MGRGNKISHNTTPKSICQRESWLLSISVRSKRLCVYFFCSRFNFDTITRLETRDTQATSLSASSVHLISLSLQVYFQSWCCVRHSSRVARNRRAYSRISKGHWQHSSHHVRLWRKVCLEAGYQQRWYDNYLAWYPCEQVAIKVGLGF